MELSGNKIIPEKINQVLNDLGILKLKNRKIETLSGGERRRVVIAGSILKEAEIILADEPTGNLDKANSEMVMELLQKIKKNRIIIVVSHDLEMAKLYADRIIKISDGVIIEDYHPRETDSDSGPLIQKESPKTSGKLGFINILRMSLGNIGKRLSSFITICFALSFALASLLTITLLNISLHDMTSVMTKNYLETDLVTVSKNASGYYRSISAPISAEDLKQLINPNDFLQVTPIYNTSLYLNTESRNEKISCRQIAFNSFYEERIMALEIEGEFPKDKYQFIISEEVKEKLNVEIGDTVSLHNGNDYHLDLEIVGINKTVTFDKINYCYIHNEVVKELLEIGLQNPKMIQVMNAKRNEANVRFGGVKTYFGVMDGTENIIAGNAPGNDQEILISSFLFSNMLREVNEDYKNISVDDLLAGSVDTNILNDLFSTDFVMEVNDVYLVRISGVFLSEENLIKVQADTCEKYYKALPSKLEMFAKEEKTINILEEKLNEDDFTVIIHSKHLRGTILKNTLIMQAAFILVSFILLILSASLINTYVKLNVRERIYDIGILKALGARKMTIFKVFWWDFIILSLISTVFGVGLANLSRIILPLVSDSLGLISLDFPIWLVFASFLFALIISFISSFLPLFKATRLSPVEAIRKR